MNDGDYKSSVRVTPERLIASVLAGLWVVIAWREYGLPIGIRTGIFYTVVLTFVWIPDLMARLEIRGQNRDVGATGPISPTAFRWVAWLMILGLPAGWFLLFRTFQG